jgi:outer membrane protein assembly factor BamE (lipoprotein component of BamABCDE complex)
MQILRVLAKVVLCAVVLASCVTNGKDFPSDLNWIKKNQTTQSDVRMLLGEPYSIGSSSGRATWTYGYYKYKLFGKSNTKELKLYWDDKKVVEDFSFNSSFPQDTGQPTTAPVPRS